MEVFIKPSVQVVDSGSQIKLQCNINGHPIQNVKWTLNGKPLGEETESELTSVKILSIPSANRQDEGMYQCFVSNNWEEVQSTAQIILGGKTYLLHNNI